MKTGKNDEPRRFGEFVARLTDGTLTSQEAAQLNEILSADPTAQEAYLDHLAMHALLEREFGGTAPTMVQSLAPVGRDVVVRRPGRRFGGLAQMAAGVVLGAFLASAVWTYALPFIGGLTGKLVPLQNADFESPDAPPPNGVPTRADLWSGDFVKIVGPERGVTPHSGGHMLRFLRADDAQTAPGAPARASELWQLIDLRALRGTLGDETVTFQFYAWFNAAPHPGRRYTCGVAIVACRGEATEAPNFWRHRHQVALAESDREEVLDDDPKTWQRVETQLAAPPDAELLLVQVRVSDKSAAASDGPSIFAAHYVDDISLRVVSRGAQNSFALNRDRR